MGPQKPIERTVECLAGPPRNPPESRSSSASSDTGARAQGLTGAHRFVETPPLPHFPLGSTCPPFFANTLKISNKKEAQLGENVNCVQSADGARNVKIL